MDKKSLRQELRKLRGNLGEENRIKYSAEIWKALKELDQFKNARKIGVYLDFGSEVKTTPYALELLGDKEVYVPRLNKKGGMDFVEFTGLDNMKAGAFGILEPVEGRIIAPEELDLILMPGLGFTLDGARLGYGGGYYDGYLPSTKALLLALAFEVQIKEELPLEEWDQLIHGLVTEKRFYSI